MPRKPKALTADDLPDDMRPRHIIDYLHLRSETVYELLKKPVKDGGIPNVFLGGKFRIWKPNFLDWCRKFYGGCPDEQAS